MMMNWREETNPTFHRRGRRSRIASPFSFGFEFVTMNTEADFFI
jgi:hypothetical protein